MKKYNEITSAWSLEKANSCKFKTNDYVEIIKTKQIGIICSHYADNKEKPNQNRYYVKFIQTGKGEIIDEILDENELRKLTRKEKQKFKRELLTKKLLES